MAEKMYANNKLGLLQFPAIWPRKLWMGFGVKGSRV